MRENREINAMMHGMMELDARCIIDRRVPRQENEARARAV